MTDTMREIMNPCLPTVGQPGFPHAPEDWTMDLARSLAKAEDIDLREDHWELIRSLHSYFARHQSPVNARELHDALDEKFHPKGGLKYLYGLFPAGPVVQGCRFAGLEIVPGVVDNS
ncbi:sulfite reductase [Achromatium sp. WMS2]|nr:sulfite reductase [Achromatium sp. WMS2]